MTDSTKILSKILIVEDESIIALYIKRNLLEAGYEVVAIVGSGEEAVESAAIYQPDLILMDIRLQGAMDGIEAARQIGEQSEVPIVFLTAHTDRDMLDRAKATDPFGYLIKPFDDHNLIITIEIALARSSAEETIRESLRQQKIFNELRSRFVAVVSHELRNPLSSILFSSELLQRYGDTLSADRREIYFERIYGAVHRMNQLLNEVLIIEETDMGKLECHPMPLDLKLFCQKLISEIPPEENANCIINFIYDLAPELPVDFEIRVDRKLLSHILGNLLANAVKYSIYGNAIRFRVHVMAKEICFEVADHGIGIPEADLPSLFSNFHRGANVKAISGTGLGLSIVKQCVELHGGTIAVQSVENQGSTFKVTLPITGEDKSWS
jgi:signal transduction histidine kinase